MSELRIGLIDSNELVRVGRGMVINAQPDMRVVLEETDPLLAIERAPNYLVDAMLVGPSQHRLRGDQFIRSLCLALHEAQNDCAVIAYSAFSSPSLRFEAIKAGAQDFVGLDGNASELIALLKRVTKKDFLVEPELLRNLRKDFGPTEPLAALEQKLNELSDFENKCLQLFLTGLGDHAISKQLDISRTRVTQFIESLIKLAGFTTRNQLALALVGELP